MLFVFLQLGCNPQPKEASAREQADSVEVKPDSLQMEVTFEIDLSSKKSDIREIKHSSTPLENYTKEDLRTLQDSGVFDLVHEYMISSLEVVHKNYYLRNPELKLLSYASGDIFRNKQKDYLFINFANDSTVISFIVYNSLISKYLELYKDIGVEQGIHSDSCYYGPSGTLDYQLANEIAWLKDGFLKEKISFREYSLCSVGSLDSNENIIDNYGCYSSAHQKESSVPSICFPTSLVYNNWDCLKYNPENDVFEIYYSQAFAD